MTETESTFTEPVRTLTRRVTDGVLRLDPALWTEPAGTLTWTRWETAEHVADDLLVYGANLAAPYGSGDLPFATTTRRPGAPDEMLHCTLEAGPAGLAAVIESASNILLAVVRTAPPEVTAPHVYGPVDADGVAAMATVELLVHGHDLFDGTDVGWAPEERLCRRILTRLFPDVEISDTGDSWTTLLWATGRTALPGWPTRHEWRWYN